MITAVAHPAGPLVEGKRVCATCGVELPQPERWEDAWTETADIAEIFDMKRTAVSMTIARAIRQLRWPPGRRPAQQSHAKRLEGRKDGRAV